MIVKLKPLAFTKVWGGDKLSRIYGFPMAKIGEIWGISAHNTNSNEIVNGRFKGMTLRELFVNYREYFGHYSNNEFPLLFKIIDAKSDLSVQVHPNDKYAFIHENSYGKDECWYIINADNDSRIQIGHKAQNRSEIRKAILNNKLEEILDYHTVSKENYYYIPSGKVHAICKNTILLEVSQSSDITYRLYDYNRLDNGKLRTLHINKALDVISFPDTQIKTQHNNKYFTFDIIKIHDITIKAHVYGDYLYIIEGNGTIDNDNISKGDFLIITSNCKYRIQGGIKLALVRITR